MGQLINIYCDESCHLERDRQRAMTIGGVWCFDEKKDQILTRLREIKLKHKFPKDYEIKWSHIFPSQIDFYLDIIDYFFDSDDLHFRCLVIPDKEQLKHEEYNQSHDDWYYKMYFDMLKVILDPTQRYNIYIDIKDTNGGLKVKKLHDVLCNSLYDFDKNIVKKIQLIRSHEVGIIQLTDLLIGALSYFHRDLTTSNAKQRIISRIIERSGYPLKRSTLYKEDKFNIFIWNPS